MKPDLDAIGARAKAASDQELVSGPVTELGTLLVSPEEAEALRITWMQRHRKARGYYADFQPHTEKQMIEALIQIEHVGNQQPRLGCAVARAKMVHLAREALGLRVRQ